ncbi:MAG: PASTA domain-containing protein [Chloroflexota bacterium]
MHENDRTADPFRPSDPSATGPGGSPDPWGRPGGATPADAWGSAPIPPGAYPGGPAPQGVPAYPPQGYAQVPHSQVGYPQAPAGYPQQGYPQQPYPPQAYGASAPTPAAGTSGGGAGGGRGSASAGGTGGSSRGPVLLAGGIIAAAAAIALGVVVVLFAPPQDGGTALGTPQPTVFVTPAPTTGPTAEPTAEPARIAAPRLTGRALRDADREARRKNLRVEVTYVTTDEAQPDTVLDQDPAPGIPVAPGETIYLTVAAQRPTVRVPDLRGVDPDEAINALLEAELRPGGEAASRFDPVIPAGLLLATEPRAGVEVPVDTVVTWITSDGPAPTAVPAETPAAVAVPDVRLRTVPETITRILEADLAPGARTDAYDPSVPANRIVRTEPAIGTLVARGTVVDYVVSLGPVPAPTPTGAPTAAPTPDAVLVPDVARQPEADAISILVGAGLTLGERRALAHPEIAAGRVIGTDPAIGTLVVRGTRVSYDVSTGPLPTAEPTPELVPVPRIRTLPEDAAIAALIAAGLVPGERSERTNAEIPAGHVLGSEPRPDTLVAPGTAIAYTVSLGAPTEQTPEPPPEPPTEPTPEPTAEPTAPPDDPTPPPSGPEADLAAPAAAIADLRGAGVVLPPAEQIGENRPRRALRDAWDAALPEPARAEEEAILRGLGQIPADASLRELAFAALDPRTAAWWDAETATIGIVDRGAGWDAAARVSGAVALAEARAAALFGPDALVVADPAERDRAIARTAFAAGDAAETARTWALGALPPEDAWAPGAAIPATDPAILAGLPAVVGQEAWLGAGPGSAFVRALRDRDGWGAVDAAWGRPPASTEQILHPERYPDDRPVRVELPDLAAALGDGWVSGTGQVFGELRIGVWLSAGMDAGTDADGRPVPAGASAAEGWGGDRIVALDGPDGRTLLAWQTAWDSDADAAEFAAAAGAIVAGLPAGAVIPGADLAGGLPAPVLVLVASDAETLALAEVAVGLGG